MMASANDANSSSVRGADPDRSTDATTSATAGPASRVASSKSDRAAVATNAAPTGGDAVAGSSGIEVIDLTADDDPADVDAEAEAAAAAASEERRSAHPSGAPSDAGAAVAGSAPGTKGSAAARASPNRDASIRKYRTGILAVVAMKKGGNNRAGTGSLATIKKYLAPDFEAQGIEWDDDLFKRTLKRMLSEGELVLNMTGALYMLPPAVGSTSGRAAAAAAAPIRDKREVSIDLPTGALGAGIQRDGATGMCVVRQCRGGGCPPLRIGDEILSLNGIGLSEVDDAGVNVWVSLFSAFASGRRRVVVRRDRRECDGGEATMAKRPFAADSEASERPSPAAARVSLSPTNAPGEDEGAVPRAEDLVPMITAALKKEGPLSQPTIKRRIQPKIKRKGLRWDDSLCWKVLAQMVRDGDIVKKKASYFVPSYTY